MSADQIEEGVAAYLEAVAELQERNGGERRRKAGFVYPSMHAFVLAEGRRFEAKPVPPGLHYGPLRECFVNAFHAAWGSAFRRPRGLSDGRYRYVEGFAAGLIPCHHAWLVDNEDGKAIDVTWRWEGNQGSPAKEAEYFGIEIPIKVAIAVVTVKETYGVLEHADIYRRPWATTKAEAEEKA